MHVPRSHYHMMFTIVVLAGLISQTFLSGFPLYVKRATFGLICDPQNCISIDRERCFLTLLLAIPVAVMLSQCNVVGGCGRLI